MEFGAYPLGHFREALGRGSLEGTLDRRVLSSRRVVIFSDFDGTISHQDSLKLLLNEYADADWPLIERAMAVGEMPESIGLQKSFDQMNLSFEEGLRFVLREVKLDSHFKNFARWAQTENHELRILSGGFENFIRPLLRREGLQHLKVLANSVEVRDGAWSVTACPTQKLCSQCNHCKSASLLNELTKDPNVFLVYIGDGHTDTCAIQLADLVFAKGFLKDYCNERALAFIPFENFSDIHAELQSRIERWNAFAAA